MSSSGTCVLNKGDFFFVLWGIGRLKIDTAKFQRNKVQLSSHSTSGSICSSTHEALILTGGFWGNRSLSDSFCLADHHSGRMSQKHKYIDLKVAANLFTYLPRIHASLLALGFYILTPQNSVHSSNAISKLSEKLPPFVAVNVFAIDFSDRNSDINVVNIPVTACRHHVNQKVTF